MKSSFNYSYWSQKENQLQFLQKLSKNLGILSMLRTIEFELKGIFI